jgi:hypothetical protein
VELRKLGDRGFRIHCGETARPIGGTDVNGDGFSDVVIQSDGLLYVLFGSGAGVRFIRGDANADGRVDLSDAVTILGHLFLGTAKPACLDAADTDDTGKVEITDAIHLLGALFLGQGSIPAPYPSCGLDETPGGPGCAASTCSKP